MNKYSLSALVAAGLLAGGMSAGSASAADLGGNCCADLEERIAELEATTARKGNRKVSLTISGWVSQQVMWWDDGGISNVYITDTGSVSIGTHVKFSGQATIVPGWSAGYVLNLEAMTNDSLAATQFNGGRGGNAFAKVQGTTDLISVESSYWFIKSDALGKVSVGQQSSAADNQAILPDGSGSLVVANYVLYDVNSFFIRNKGGQLINQSWGSLAGCAPVGGAVSGDCDGYPYQSVRYDSPTFAGFSLSASWGADDIWAVSGRYAGEWSGFKVAAAAAYSESNDLNGPFNRNSTSFNQDPTLGIGGGSVFGTALATNKIDLAAFQVGAYVEHVPTGLFLYGAYHKEFWNVPSDLLEDGSGYYVKAGIRQRWSPLGHTVLYGEYGNDDDATVLKGDHSNLSRWGVGAVQEIDAAAMSLWLAYRHYHGSQTGGSDGVAVLDDNGNPTGATADGSGFQDFELVKGGALINF